MSARQTTNGCRTADAHTPNHSLSLSLRQHRRFPAGSGVADVAPTRTSAGGGRLPMVNLTLGSALALGWTLLSVSPYLSASPLLTSSEPASLLIFGFSQIGRPAGR